MELSQDIPGTVNTPATLTQETIPAVIPNPLTALPGSLPDVNAKVQALENTLNSLINDLQPVLVLVKDIEGKNVFAALGEVSSIIETLPQFMTDFATIKQQVTGI